MKVDIKIRNLDKMKAALRDYPGEMSRNLNKAMTKAGILFRSRAEQFAPKRTGYLARTHELRLTPFRAEIFPTAKYATFVHQGTKPHTISVVNKKVLTDGKTFFGRSVMHPGTKAKPWLKWTVTNTEKEIQGFFDKALKDTLDEVARRADD